MGHRQWFGGVMGGSGHPRSGQLPRPPQRAAPAPMPGIRVECCLDVHKASGDRFQLLGLTSAVRARQYVL